MIGLVALVALLIVLAGMSLIKILESPPEVFVVIAMIAVSFFALRDILRMPTKNKND